MLLYHYAKERHPILLTKEKQNTVTPEDRKNAEKEYIEHFKKTGYKRPGYYFEHISFFFEPVPLEIMSTIFPRNHSIWTRGNMIFEHVVDSTKIKLFDFEVVEFPEKTEIYYDDSLTDKEYFNKLKQAIKENGYIGKNNEALESVSRKFLGHTEEYFKAIKDRPNYKDIKEKYAATVPHVMLYPHIGKIPVRSIQLVKVN